MTPPRPVRREEEMTTALLRESTDSITALIEDRLPMIGQFSGARSPAVKLLVGWRSRT